MCKKRYHPKNVQRLKINSRYSRSLSPNSRSLSQSQSQLSRLVSGYVPVVSMFVTVGRAREVRTGSPIACGRRQAIGEVDVVQSKESD